MKIFGKIGVIAFTISACVSAVFFDRWLDLRAQRVTPGELYAAIYSQLIAVRCDDMRAAYQQSASSVRENFSFAEFKRTISDDFADVAFAARIEFGAIHTRGRRAIVQVFFINAAERVTPCIYSLVNEGDGWKISGSKMLKRWEAGERLTGIRS